MLTVLDDQERFSSSHACKHTIKWLLYYYIITQFKGEFGIHLKDFLEICSSTFLPRVKWKDEYYHSHDHLFSLGSCGYDGLAAS